MTSTFRTTYPQLPITPRRQQLRQQLQTLPIILIKPIHNSTINIYHPNRLPAHNNRHDNLAPARPITSNMIRELFNIGHQLCLLGRSSEPTYASRKRDGLTCHAALERSEDELRGRAGVKDVETLPGEHKRTRRDETRLG